MEVIKNVETGNAKKSTKKCKDKTPTRPPITMPKNNPTPKSNKQHFYFVSILFCVYFYLQLHFNVTCEIRFIARSLGHRYDTRTLPSRFILIHQPCEAMILSGRYHAKFGANAFCIIKPKPVVCHV